MNPTENHLTIGLDLGDLKGCALSGRQHAVCVLNAAGDIVAEESIPNTREVLTAFAARYPAATFVMETGTHSPWVSRLLATLGHPVIVANARKLRAISQSHAKSDRADVAVERFPRVVRIDSRHCHGSWVFASMSQPNRAPARVMTQL